MFIIQCNCLVLPEHDKQKYFATMFDPQFQQNLIILDFLESLEIFLINLVIILMMLAKMVTPGFLETMVLWNKAYDVISLSCMNFCY